MPVVELSYSRLLHLIDDSKITKKDVSERLPYLGLDIEYDDDTVVRVEYSPNRPDYSTDIGIALGLQGLLGVRSGPPQFGFMDGTATYSINATESVTGVRPIITGIVAKRHKENLDDVTLRQLVTMQEDLHAGLGRNRRKVAIGLHDLDKIGRFPLTYTTTSPSSHKFVPLNGQEAMTVSEILTGTKAGRAYASLLGDASRVPVILDADKNTISLPPIINSDMTMVTTDTKNILVDITGTSRHATENVLGIVAMTLKAAGFSLESIRITGSGNSTPKLAYRTQTVTTEEISERLGLDITAADAVSFLGKARLEAVKTPDGAVKCKIPPYRSDITSSTDLVEEVVLGYGAWRLKPRLSPPQTFGSFASPESQVMASIDKAMIGMGYLEALNPSLSSARILYEAVNRRPDMDSMVMVVDSKSSEHTIMRDMLLPGLVENLSRNVHEQYPQRLYETGTVFLKQAGARHSGPGSSPDSNIHPDSRGDKVGRGGACTVSELTNLACVTAHAKSDYAETKSVLQSLLDTDFGIKFQTIPDTHHIFEDGRCARIVAQDYSIGYAGMIDSAITALYRIRVPVCGFEISLNGSLL